MKASRKTNRPEPTSTEVRRADIQEAGLDPADLDRALEWVLPLGVCCAEAQADGVPCAGIGGDCLVCDLADPIRQLLLRMAATARIH